MARPLSIEFQGALYRFTPTPTAAPGPLPVLGAAAAFCFSRQLRKRIKRSMLPVESAID
jgi:hypothetical protein